MIARLRQRHRVAWLVLAVGLPVILLVAWRARRPSAVMERLPVELREEAKP